MAKKRDAPEQEIQESIRVKLAKEIVLEYIYHSPVLFGFSDFCEDSKSMFMLSIITEIPKLLTRFDPEQCCFLTYFVQQVKYNAQNWAREAAKRKAAEDSLALCYERTREEGLEIAEEESEYVPTGQPIKKAASDTLKILVLKAAYSISDHHVDLVANITGCDKAELSELVEATKNTLQTKEVRHKQAAEGRNKAFFYKTRYGLELKKLIPGTSQYKIVKRQFAYQARMLDLKNKLLRTKLAVVPTNAYVAEILNIPHRRVSRLLEQAAGIMKKDDGLMTAI